MHRVAFLLFLPLLAAAQDWRFGHPDATFVGGIRPQAILSSPLMAAAIEDAAQRDPSVAALFTMGRGFLESISEIRFSALDNGSPEPDILALVSGRMDDAVVRMMGQGTTKVKRIDNSTLLLGKGKSFAQAAARMTKTSAAQPQVLVGTDALWANDIWFAGHIPESAITAMLAAQGMKVHGIRLGVSFGDPVHAELGVDTASAAMAQKLIQLAADAEGSQYKGLTHYSVHGTSAHFSADMPQQLALLAARGGFAASSAMAAAPPVLQEPPQRKTIVIQGLADGPREIPLEQRR